jgi:hypothetical protein
MSMRWGDWKEEDGILYSNLNHKPANTYYGRYEYTRQSVSTAKEEYPLVDAIPVTGREWIAFTSLTKMDEVFKYNWTKVTKDGKTIMEHRHNKDLNYELHGLDAFTKEGKKLWEAAQMADEYDDIPEQAWEKEFLEFEDSEQVLEFLEEAEYNIKNNTYIHSGTEYYVDWSVCQLMTKEAIKELWPTNWSTVIRDLKENSKITKDWEIVDKKEILAWHADMDRKKREEDRSSYLLQKGTA